MNRAITAILDRFSSLLEATGNYRVLRRLTPEDRYSSDVLTDAFTGIILDTETTGLTPGTDDVIELGMIRFDYSPEGKIGRVLATFNQLQQPSKPIPAEITAITGITDSDVAGCRIDPASVEAFVAGASLVIAHNANFDRPMCEATWPLFRNLNWACSFTQIPWKDEGHEGGKLGYLLNDYGYFHNGHRAIDDCRALLHLLAQPLQCSKRAAMSALLDNARKTEYRLWAQTAPFDSKDILKARGYRWDGAARCWFTLLDESALAAEEEFLHRDICPGRSVPFPRDKITARNRFSQTAREA